jgi:DNA-binding transcriptional LysR family regulator
MQTTKLDWDDVQLFLSLVRTRRLGATAKALGFDTSTASRRLARLEGQLAVTLFDRTREGLVPTAAAQRLLGSAEEMERASHVFSRELDGFEREAEGAVTLSVPPGVAESFVAPLLGELARRHPKLRFELDASTRQADLSRREADLAIRTIRPSGGPLVRQLLTRAPWVPMATPEQVAVLGTVQRWADVPWITYGFELGRLHVAKWLGARVKRPPFLRTNSFGAQVSAVQQGLGAALVPAPYASVHRLEPLRLSRKLTLDAKTLPVDELWLVTHEALRHVPRVAATWDCLVQHFREPPRAQR